VWTVVEVKRHVGGRLQPPSGAGAPPSGFRLRSLWVGR
jgi:hypothetical protein